MDRVIVISTRATIGRLAPPIESYGGTIIRVQRARVDNKLWGKPFGEQPVTFIEVEIEDGLILSARMRDEYPEARVCGPNSSLFLAVCLWSHHFEADEESLSQLLQEESFN